MNYTVHVQCHFTHMKKKNANAARVPYTLAKLATLAIIYYSGISLLRTSELRTPPLYTDVHWRSQTVGHRNVYLLDLQIKDTSLFRITDAWSSPKQSYCIVNKLYNTVKATPLSSIASTSAAVPHGLSWRWLIYQTKMPNTEISLSTRPPLDLVLLSE